MPFRFRRNNGGWRTDGSVMDVAWAPVVVSVVALVAVVVAVAPVDSFHTE